VFTNVGTAQVDYVELSSTLPKYFEPPTADKFKVEVVNGANTKIVNKGLNIQIKPPNQDPMLDHEIIVEVTDLSDEVLLPPKAVLKVSYPIMARNPQPNVDYPTPLKARVNTQPRGVEYHIAEDPVAQIGIQYIKRKVKTMKSVSPGADPNSFQITVKITNSGVDLEEILVREDVPAGFAAGSFRPSDLQPKFAEGAGGSTLTWLIPLLREGEVMKLSYEASGEGEFPRSEPTVSFKEMVEATEAPAGSAAPAPAKKKLDGHKALQVMDAFDDAYKKMNMIKPAAEVANMVEGLKEQLLGSGIMGSIIQTLTGLGEELTALGNKMVLGDLLDETIAKLNKVRKELIE
jgi:hypothetical protein